MNSKQTNVSELLGISMEKLREMADINSIIGDPIKLDDGTTILPISKVSYGFASGGADIPSKSDKALFGGGVGAGVSINPEGFLVISNGTAKMVPMSSGSDPISAVMSSVPEAVDKIAGFLKKKKGSDPAQVDDATADITVE